MRFLIPSLLSVAATAQAVDFEQHIRPLLKERCVECHGAAKQKGGLRLDARSLAFKGGDSGAAIVAGNARGSALWRRVASLDEDERMPPKGAPLTPEETAVLKEWLDGGAVWPESQADRDALIDGRLKHWSFQPVRELSAPAVKGGGVRNAIDAFVQARLKEVHLQQAPEADRRTLIRRLSFDLLGLPPAPEAVTAFVEDADPRAHEKLVDRFLMSPQYGERWARHWLDIAHYADTHGFERDQLRPNAWPYRDYVIRALNTDKPYDQFLREQIAGDVLAPEVAEAVIATGFLAAGPWDFVGNVETKSDMLKRAARAGDLDDMVTQVMTSSMGLTINCARCHDHKLDPITQEEYYRLWSVFAGVTRGEREIDTRTARERAAIEARLNRVRAEEAALMGEPLSLADMVGGGDGRGTGTKGVGITLDTGEIIAGKRGYQRDLPANRLVAPKGKARLVRGVFVPGGGDGSVNFGRGVFLAEMPRTSGHAWDAVRNGLLNAQVHARAGGVDYSKEGHSVLGLHANAGVVFDLEEIRKTHGLGNLRFSAVAACGAEQGAKDTFIDFSVYVDGALVKRIAKLKKDASTAVEVEAPQSARFLTLMATDGGDGIGHDLFFLGDPRLRSSIPASYQKKEELEKLSQLRRERNDLERTLERLPKPRRMYGIVTETPAVIQVQRRGNPEDAEQEVLPGGPACVGHQPAEFGTQTTAEGDRRAALARWITHPDNPLTRRVLVNRLWHHHFGQGLVATPSDFGLGGDRPSHPELLDWLAAEFLRSGWSIKAIHRLICTSATYRQSSVGKGSGQKIDAANRLLWRQNPRRLDAEMLRDAVLVTCGTLNLTSGGPGFRDFDYTEAYAPIYRYTAADAPELWRRSIYRFVVRTTPHPFLTTLDCPDPANFTPARVVTTTALQALTLSNNDFMLKQTEYFARQVEDLTDSTEKAVVRAFQGAVQRLPTAEEMRAAVKFVETAGLFSLCRMLINSNEFIYID